MSTFYTKEQLNTIGFKNLGDNVLISRNALIYNPEKISVGNNVRIDDFAILSGTITFGDYIHVAQFCGLYGGKSGLIMEDYTSLSSKVSIYCVSDDYSGRSMTNPMIPSEYKPGAIDKPVTIERFVAIGASCVILPGVTLKEGSSFSAMSLVYKDSEAYMIYAGVPARRVSDRSKDFLQLEEQFRKNLTK